MTIQTTYTQARAGLAKLLDRVSQDREVVIIQRRNAEDVALIAADELVSILETAHLLQSPANAERLLTALGRALKEETPPTNLASLYQEIDLEPESTGGGFPTRIY